MTARWWLVLALVTSVTGCSLLIDTDPFQARRDGGTTRDADAFDADTPDGDTPDPDGPSAPVVRITPEAPVTTDALTLEIVTESVDPLEAGPVVYGIEWLRGGENAGIAEATVPASETAKGETWTVRVTPTSADGTRTGAAGTAEATIGNLPPALGYVGLGHYRPIRGESLEALTGPVTDPDGDTTRYVYTWLLDGEPIEGETGPRLVLDSVDAGARVKVRVTPRDADGLDGEALETGEAIVVEDTIRWRQLTPDRFYRNGGQFVYDASNRRVLVFYHPSDREPVDLRVWEYALEPLGARWIELHPSGNPIRLFGAKTILDERNRRVLFVGGYEDGAPSSRLVSFDLSVRGAERWEELSPSGDLPTVRQFSAIAYDAERQRVLLYGGVDEGWETAGLEPVNDLMTLDVSRPGFETWTHMVLPGAGVAAPTVVIDSGHDRALFLGGLAPGTGGAPTLLDTIHTLDLNAPSEGLSLSTARLPTGLFHPTAVADAERDRVLIAWGLDNLGSPTASIRAFDLETFAATDVSPGGSVPVPGLHGFMAVDPYDPTRMIVHPGPPEADGDGSRPRFDLYQMDIGTAEFAPFVRYGVDEPPALSGANGARDARSFILFGGESLREPSAAVWRFDTFTGRWSELTMVPDVVTGRAPEPRSMAGATMSLGDLMIFGGVDSVTPVPSAAWTMHPLAADEGEWVEHTVVTDSPVPEPRQGPSVFDPRCGGAHLGVFGGMGQPGYQDETWALRCVYPEVRGCTWEPLPVTASPSPRAHSTVDNLSPSDKVLLYGGIGDTGALDDLWLLEACAEPPTWTAVSATGTAPARWGHTMTRREDDTLTGLSRWVVFGGFSNSDREASASNEVWMLIDESGAYRWERVAVADGPNDPVIDPRGAHVAAWNEERTLSRLLVYGGGSRNVRSDLWELRFPRAAP